MSNLISFPTAGAQTTNEVVDYTGRVLTLNMDKARSFTCGGFVLGPRLTTSVVPPEAQMYNIHKAVLEGKLLDITDQEKVQTPDGTHMEVQESDDTGRKAYFVNYGGNLVLLVPKDAEEQAAIEAQAASQSTLVLPPGFGNEEKYLIKLDTSGLEGTPIEEIHE